MADGWQPNQIPTDPQHLLAKSAPAAHKKPSILFSDIVFPELEKELVRNYRKIIRDQTKGYFHVRILRHGVLVAEW
jgi:hypothetical protein